MKRKTADITAALALTAAAAALIWAGREAKAEAAAAVTLCLTVMIPSLYAFTALSRLLITTGSYRLIARPFSAVSRYIFRMPEEFFPVFVISQLAGYPIGAALISGMKEEGRLTGAQAENLLCFCIAPGPAYVMAVSAIAAPTQPRLWQTVMAGIIGANLIAAFVTAPLRPLPQKSGEPVKVTFSAKLFTGAVGYGAESMTAICGMIIFMAAGMGILSKAGILAAAARLLARITGLPAAQAYPLVRSFFEISNLCRIFGDSFVTLPAAAGLMSFGGLCVCMQIKAVCRGFSPAKAFICRIPIAAAAFFICRQLIPRFSAANAVTVMAPVSSPEFVEYSPLLSIFLLIMTILILSQKSMVKSEKL